MTDAAIKGSKDYLRGLKENVIIGKLIPAGSVLRRKKQRTSQEFLEQENFQNNINEEEHINENEVNVEDMISDF